MILVQKRTNSRLWGHSAVQFLRFDFSRFWGCGRKEESPDEALRLMLKGVPDRLRSQVNVEAGEDWKTASRLTRKMVNCWGCVIDTISLGVVKQEFWIPQLHFSRCSHCQRWCYICGLLLEVWSSLLISDDAVGHSECVRDHDPKFWCAYLLACWFYPISSTSHERVMLRPASVISRSPLASQTLCHPLDSRHEDPLKEDSTLESLDARVLRQINADLPRTQSYKNFRSVDGDKIILHILRTLNPWLQMQYIYIYVHKRHHKAWKKVKKRCLNRNQTLTWGFLWQDLSDSSKLWRSKGETTRTIAPDLCLRSSWHRSGWRGFGVGTQKCICRKCLALANLFWALQDTARAWTTLLDFYCLFLKMYLLHTLLSWSLCRFLPSQAGVGRYNSAQFGFWLTSSVERIGSCFVQACTLKGYH